MNINSYNKTPMINIIEQSNTLAKKNTSFSLIGLCVSYNYFETLKIMLPLNYNHFTHIYLVTQKDDIQTIEFCKYFDNVEVILFDFNNNNKKFDKYGGLNKIQELAYKNYPDSWYLIIDSDIVLPANFIDLIKSQNLNDNYIYGGYRNNLNKLSDIHLFLDNKFNLDKYNFINWKKQVMILGCFQLYKKHHYHVLDDTSHINYGTAGHFDLKFTESFETRKYLDLIFVHLGKETDEHLKNNWSGKVIDFNIDININISKLNFNYITIKKPLSPLTIWKNKRRSEKWII